MTTDRLVLWSLRKPGPWLGEVPAHEVADQRGAVVVARVAGGVVERLPEFVLDADAAVLREVPVAVSHGRTAYELHVECPYTRPCCV